MKRLQPATRWAKLLCVGLSILFLSACSSIQTVKNPDSGEVLLRLLINENGRVENIEVVKAEPSGYFEESAVKAFREKKFSPAMKGGIPIKSKVLIRVTYEPTGAARSETNTNNQEQPRGSSLARSYGAQKKAAYGYFNLLGLALRAVD